MLKHEIQAGAKMAASLMAAGGLDIGAVGMTSVYRFECIGADGKVKWVEEVKNLVVNEGLNDLLSKYLKGSSYTAAFYVGLKGAGTVAAADTLASHAGWSEVNPYTGNRKTLTLGSVASQSVDNSGSVAAFAITTAGPTTVAGGFVATVNTGTSGVLYGAANFSNSRDVIAGDTLNVTVTLTASGT